MFKVWVQILPGPAQSHGRCEPSNHAAVAVCRLSAQISALDVCRLAASAAAHRLAAEAGPGASSARTEYVLRVGHSSHNSAPSLFDIRRTGKLLTYMQNRHCSLSLLPLWRIRPKWFLQSRSAAMLLYPAHICCGKSLRKGVNVVLTSVAT